jgi:feruloyl esterase
MRRSIALLITNVFLSLPVSASTCESLANLPLAHGTITAAKSVPLGAIIADVSPAISDHPPFCRVTATLTPSLDSNIRIEVWMPTDGWNGKYEGTGNGGYGGGIAYGGLADGIRRGYAVANTDMGTAHASMVNGDGLIGHPERWADWGWRSTHEMTVTAKQIIHAYYEREPDRSYFTGCSTGGEQGLMEAQRFPDDYDGIVAGAPANNRTRLHMDILWNFVAGEKSPADSIPAAKLPVITKAILNGCARAKATEQDVFLSTPEDCRWDPKALTCKTGDAPDCLTAEQITTVRNLYNGPRNPVTHKSIYPGVPRGSEFGWTNVMPQTPDAPYDSLFKWVFGPGWNWRNFDFNHDVATVDARLAPMLNATNPDLSVFKAHEHKLLEFHGWADWLVPPEESIGYYRSVADVQSNPAASHNRSQDEETQTFYRLFMVPGMAHCSGGPGLNTLDPLPSLELWVENGIAPDKIIAARTDSGTTQMTRPLCPFPQTARYNGTGDTEDAGSFSCASPGQSDAQ